MARGRGRGRGTGGNEEDRPGEDPEHEKVMGKERDAAWAWGA